MGPMYVDIVTPDDAALPGALLTEITEVYASAQEFHELTGDFPDAGNIRVPQVAAALADELSVPGSVVHLARIRGELVAVAVTLDHHPADPGDPDAWIGLLLVHGARRREGHGRALAGHLAARFREAGRTGLRLAVLDTDAPALAFWEALGYTPVDHRPDLRRGRRCAVLRKDLAETGTRPEGAVTRGEV
ncbi:GNAT family N-acetyltransferase [Streptomyces sp. TSRI0384-2]|uniref:GNAT family N-acetyltransferase n=1 Tax=Streptomyces TaxID=1883 RepID=UPI000C2601B2|nr:MULTISPECIES: GNAT family N-acetyltransferase [unclassified Streptomyces]MDQ0294082.1 ribosomal protein S18 acetylase RimI-like enzyme [Streptomyces sp. DSM 41037]PJM82112.1 GNAT family N-acetyltransferase [Streptomyces sp. TSRI0384-2]